MKGRKKDGPSTRDDPARVPFVFEVVVDAHRRQPVTCPEHLVLEPGAVVHRSSRREDRERTHGLERWQHARCFSRVSQKEQGTTQTLGSECKRWAEGVGERTLPVGSIRGPFPSGPPRLTRSSFHVPSSPPPSSFLSLSLRSSARRSS